MCNCCYVLPDTYFKVCNFVIDIEFYLLSIYKYTVYTILLLYLVFKAKILCLNVFIISMKKHFVLIVVSVL